mgnify:CR=1 FL=1
MIHLSRNLKHSRLQKKILSHLSRGGEKSVTSIAKSIGYSRESTSRSLHSLVKVGRILESMYGYELTIWGKEEVNQVEFEKVSIKDTLISWWDASVCFDCQCGNKEIVLSDEGDDYWCECGRVYRFYSRLEVSI